MKQMSAHYLKKLDFPSLRNCECCSRGWGQSQVTWAAILGVWPGRDGGTAGRGL